MNHFLSDEQKEIIGTARKFARNEFPKIARRCDREESFPKEIWQKAAQLGFMGIFVAPEFGGLGLGYLEHAMVMEEFWRVDPGVGNILLAVFGSEVLGTFGAPAQKEKYLRAVAEGHAITGCAITEPDAGSDIFGVRTRATRTQEGYVINGSKQFITNGSIADFLLVFCVTNPTPEKPTQRFSFLLVHKGSPGFTARKLTGKMGIRASDTAELSFDNVEVPLENLVGLEEGQGFSQVMHLFNINRVVAAAQGVGVAQGALDKALAYVKERHQFGSLLSAFQGTQFKIADMAARIESSRLLYQKAAWLIDQAYIPRLFVVYSGEFYDDPPAGRLLGLRS